MSKCILVPTNNKSGYATRRYKGKMWLAHRAALDELGILDPKLFVLHKCDVKNCVNPEHLFQGTQKDNIHDMIDKGRKWDPTKLYLTHNGQTKSRIEWAKKLGIHHTTLWLRLQTMPVEQALTRGKYVRNHH